MSKQIEYNGYEYTLFPCCKRPGTSILTNNKWEAGTAIYWRTIIPGKKGERIYCRRV